MSNAGTSRLPIIHCPNEMDGSAKKGQSSGAMGCCAGIYRFQSPSECGETVTEVGKFITVFRRQQDGSWKAVIDSFFWDAKCE